MNPFDLRIGNQTNVGTITGIYEGRPNEYSAQINNSIAVHIVELKPVPITQEWISKTGIKPDIHGQYHFKGYYLHRHHSGVWNVFNTTTPHPLTELNFVHEWQNWHYALNKEELKFKL